MQKGFLFVCLFLKPADPAQPFTAGFHNLGRRDKERSGWPAEAVTPTVLANVEVFVKDRRMALQEVASQFSIRKASAHQIVHEKYRYKQGKCQVGITKTRLFKYIDIPPPKTESFQIKILIFFIFLLKT